MRRFAAAAARSARLAAAALAACAFACSGAPPPAPPAAIGAELRPFLPDPAPLSSSDAASEVARIHRELLTTPEPTAIARAAAALAKSHPADVGARLLHAEALLAADEAAAAMRELVALPAAESRRPEVALVAGRTAEALDDPVAALAWYRLAGNSAGAGPAAERLRAVEPRALEILAHRAEDLLARGRVEEAERVLAELEAVRATDRRALELGRRVAAAKGDMHRELAALRALAPASPDSLQLQLRRGELEVEVGDARAGLDLLGKLAADHPGDLLVADELERAKLVFRLANAPDAVRASAGRAQLTRADFARLLYWLLPAVRRAAGGTPRIASDILDHPAREEIVRVINHGLLRVDEVRHLFEPDRPLRRGEALHALLADPLAGGRRACAAAAGADPCLGALACGLIAEAGECLPTAPISGREAVDWIRRVPAPDESEP